MPMTKAQGLKKRKLLKNGFQELTKSKAYLLGVLCGDGYINKSGFIMQVTDPDFIQHVSNAIYDVYGITSSIYKKPATILTRGNRTYLCQPTTRLVTFSMTMVEDLSRYGNFRTYVWRIPEEILCGNDLMKQSFLQGFFDSEGTFTHAHVALSSANLQGLQQVQRLLIELGIKATLCTYGREHQMYITGQQNMLLFAKQIGFSIRRKQDKLQYYLEHTIPRQKYTLATRNMVIRLHRLGISKSSLPRIFDIPDRTVRHWIQQG